LRYREPGCERLDQGAQKCGEPPHEEVEVEADGSEDGIDAVSFPSLELVAVHSVFGLEMTDSGFDRGTPFHVAFDGGGGSVVRQTWPVIQTRYLFG
jgi:hypothetical protein